MKSEENKVVREAHEGKTRLLMVVGLKVFYWMDRMNPVDWNDLS